MSYKINKAVNIVRKVFPESAALFDRDKGYKFVYMDSYVTISEQQEKGLSAEDIGKIVCVEMCDLVMKKFP